GRTHGHGRVGTGAIPGHVALVGALRSELIVTIERVSAVPLATDDGTLAARSPGELDPDIGHRPVAGHDFDVLFSVATDVRHGDLRDGAGRAERVLGICERE